MFIIACRWEPQFRIMCSQSPSAEKHCTISSDFPHNLIRLWPPFHTRTEKNHYNDCVWHPPQCKLSACVMPLYNGDFFLCFTAVFNYFVSLCQSKFSVKCDRTVGREREWENMKSSDSLSTSAFSTQLVTDSTKQRLGMWK